MAGCVVGKKFFSRKTLENQSQQSLSDPRRRVKRSSAMFFARILRVAVLGLCDGANGPGRLSVFDLAISVIALGYLVRLVKLCHLRLSGHFPAVVRSLAGLGV